MALLRNNILFSFSLLFLSHVAQAFEEDFLSVYGDEDLISIATGSEQSIARAPSVASVISKQDILATGAKDLDEALQMVPGLHVSRSHIAYTPLYSMRGILTERNQHVLLLINGVPMTSVHFGNRNNTWGGMPVHNIERVEVIRGPGSASFGADAFAGVINVITKEYDDLNDGLGFRLGAFDTQEIWVQKKAQLGDLKSAFSMELLHTDGHNETVRFDGSQGGVSEAPGSINTRKESAEIHLDLNYNAWDLHLMYQGRFDMGTGAGVGGALDEKGEVYGYRFLADLMYNYSRPDSFWDVTVKVSYLDLEDSGDARLNSPFGPFVDGLRAKPEVFERHYRFGLSAFYMGFDNHRIRMGAGVNWDDMHKIREKRNFTKAFAPIPFENLQQDPNEVFIEPGSRRVYYFFLQDEWALAQNWDLTAGVRFDFYSDFGRTVNPRLALVWQTTEKLTSKFLFGRAFRAPSFSELFAKNNPVIQGTPGLSPEIIHTLELAGNYEFSNQLEASLNIFYYRMRQILRFVGDPLGVAANTGRQRGLGFETEFTWKPTENLRVAGNYAFQVAQDGDTKDDAGLAPHHLAYLRTDWQFWDDFYLNVQGNLVTDRLRQPADKREKVRDYYTFDFNIRYGDLDDRFYVQTGMKNMFNNIGREPSTVAAVRKDVPLPGRAWFFEAGLNLD